MEPGHDTSLHVTTHMRRFSTIFVDTTKYFKVTNIFCFRINIFTYQNVFSIFLFLSSPHLTLSHGARAWSELLAGDCLSGKRRAQVSTQTRSTAKYPRDNEPGISPLRSGSLRSSSGEN